MRRRQFIQTVAASALSTLFVSRDISAQMRGMPGMGMGGMMGGASAPRSTFPSGLPLRQLNALANTTAAADTFRGVLTASPFAASVVSGRFTELWGYNNQCPGPIIELREGQQVEIDFANRLPIESTIHWHGLAVPADQDGSPMDPVASLANRRYTFQVPMGSAGTYWYHPHAHQTTTLQVGHGLSAPLIVRAADDPLENLPELILMITGLALDSSGQIATDSLAMLGMGGMGMVGAGTLLVNGQKQPVHTMTLGATERWRIINATADRYLRLSLDGRHFAVVGTDGGLLGHPLLGLTEWLLAPAQRVEIVVTNQATQSTLYSLRDLGYRGAMNDSAGSELMTIETNNAAALAPVALPGSLRPVAELGPASTRQQVVLSTGGMGMMGAFLINGRTFDMNRVDLQTVAGRVELWDMVNNTIMDHPIHIHGTQFQVVSRTARGVTVPSGYPAWFDTVNVPAGETVTIKTRQLLPGKRMFHCHILPHEDAGMMAVLDVLPA